MSVIYVLIPVAVLLTIVGIYLFFWAVKAEQFDDLEKEGLSILFDEDSNEQNSNASTLPPEEHDKQNVKDQNS